ncbi:MAG TPA: heme-binding domain-containing protein [Saprospiraceae bacterium]|nr:heme-binding domain-containing protein [Saprospiraceae bacterium]HND87427.1 heme-binding domain-containing protein [Saprospiraceae bacterium]HNG88952.1 heme-binding domain-containing protein [Saprospiraceae bacterium]
MKKLLRYAALGLLGILVLLQFYRPARNLSNEQSHHVSTKYPMPQAVEAILKPACYDCHSNLSTYPWYANIQPVGIWLAQHINEGKQHLNFSEFTRRRAAVQNHKFEEIVESQEDGWMPLDSYTWTHHDARLSPEQRQTIIAWAKANMDSLRVWYPADSLVLKRKG